MTASARRSLSDQVEEYLDCRLGSEKVVSSVRSASEGMSDDTLLVELSEHHELRGLVLRHYRAGGVVRSEVDPERHFRILQALEGTSIPAPRAYWYDADAPGLGGPVIAMELVEGRAVVPWTQSGRTFLANAGRGPIGAQFVEILAKMHCLDWRQSALEFLATPDRRSDASRRVDELACLVREHRQGPEPILEDALGWLTTHVPKTEAITLIHGDYRSGNMLFGNDRIAAVLDWEWARLGDPDMDVAWVLSPSNRMSSDLACYLLPPDDFVSRYHEISGREPNAEAVRFWQVWYQVLNAAIWLSAEKAYSTGATTDLRMARWSYTLPTMRQLVADLLKSV